jgi:hypothetical protein
LDTRCRRECGPTPPRPWGSAGAKGWASSAISTRNAPWIQQRVRDRSIELYKVRGEVNPADLFTKHLSSNDRIQSLLAQFGCSYEDGRAVGAPLLRNDAGTSKGESLCAMDAGHNASQRAQACNDFQDMIDWGGRQFPVSMLDGVALPDAFVHTNGLLPHLHDNLAEIFPRARACKSQGDADPPEDRALEDFGAALGMEPEKKKHAAKISSEPRQAWVAPRSTA